MRAALSAPPENIFWPSCERDECVLETSIVFFRSQRRCARSNVPVLRLWMNRSRQGPPRLRRLTSRLGKLEGLRLPGCDAVRAHTRTGRGAFVFIVRVGRDGQTLQEMGAGTLGTYFAPADIQHRSFMAVHGFPLRLACRADFVNADLWMNNRSGWSANGYESQTRTLLSHDATAR